MMHFTLEQIEAALDRRHIWMCHGAINGYWVCRRNGKTKRWKRDSTRWEIPFKVGFKGTGRLQSGHVGSLAPLYMGYEWGYTFVISATQPIKGETRFVRKMKEAVLS